MTIDAMTTGNLYQRGQEPDVKASPATMEDVRMGRFKIGPKIPAAVLEKIGMKVGDKIPSDHDPDQVERWHRRGYLVVDGGRARETAQKGASREQRDADAEPGQCEGTTKAGPRCKRTAVKGSAYCSTHQ